MKVAEFKTASWGEALKAAFVAFEENRKSDPEERNNKTRDAAEKATIEKIKADIDPKIQKAVDEAATKASIRIIELTVAEQLKEPGSYGYFDWWKKKFREKKT